MTPHNAFRKSNENLVYSNLQDLQESTIYPRDELKIYYHQQNYFSMITIKL